MQEIIEQAAAGFDWVIIDTPPVGLLTDAHLLAAMVDAAVLVIDAGTTQHAIIQRAIESIGREKIVGVVLNRVEAAGARRGVALQVLRRFIANEAPPEVSSRPGRSSPDAPETAQ